MTALDSRVPRFHLAMPVDDLGAADITFGHRALRRFEGEVGEQWTVFLLEPAGNAQESKAFADDSQVVAA
jgi:extradiol dioxygenase family protein